MTVHPPTQRRAVLEEEEQAQDGERKPEYDRGQTLDAVDDTRYECGDDVGHVRLHRRIGTRRTRLVDSCARQPPLRFVGRRTRVLADLSFLTGDAADHDHDDEDAECHESEQHDDGGSGARHVPRKLCDERHRNCCDDCRGNYGAYDRVGRGKQPDQSGEEREDPDEQPGGPTQVTEPARRGECRRECLQLDHVYFGPIGADRDVAVLVSAVLREAHSHGFLLRTTHTGEPDVPRGRPEAAAELTATTATTMSPLRHAAVAHAVVDGMSVLTCPAITISAPQTARRREPA